MPWSISNVNAIEVAEDHWIRKDGSFVLVSYASAPIDMPDGRGAVVAFTDVAQRRRMERALQERDVAEARSAELSAARRRIMHQAPEMKCAEIAVRLAG